MRTQLFFPAKSYNFIIVLVILLISSCKTSIVDQVYNDYLNRNIILIDTFIIKDRNRILTQSEKNNLFAKKLKFVISIDGYCEICFSQLKSWNDSLLRIDKFDTSKISLLFYVHGKNYDPFNCYIESIKFDYPIIYDTANYFVKINHLPNDNLFNNMLIVDNKIALIGNPVLRPKLAEIYLDYIKNSTTKE